MSRYAQVRREIAAHCSTWLVTGVAGFIGSHLLEQLLLLGQRVVGLDNFSTGYRANLEDVRARIPAPSWRGFQFVEGDVADLATCTRACQGVEVVLHQAALGSVPRSVLDPITTHRANADGFLNLLVAARDAGVRRFVYASSSSVYGDEPTLPKAESRIGRPLSPYAVSKLVDELYADVFARQYGFSSIGLRYFNVFGRRQDPDGAYAAVIPAWIAALLAGQAVYVNGDGETTRDFAHVDNAVQANLLAACAPDDAASGNVYNVACGERITLNELFIHLRSALSAHRQELAGAEPVYREFRAGDIRHSLANIGKARDRLGYEPAMRVKDGLAEAIAWYVARLSPKT